MLTNAPTQNNSLHSCKRGLYLRQNAQHWQARICCQILSFLSLFIVSPHLLHFCTAQKQSHVQHESNRSLFPSTCPSYTSIYGLSNQPFSQSHVPIQLPQRQDLYAANHVPRNRQSCDQKVKLFVPCLSKSFSLMPPRGQPAASSQRS